jgi:hypothetical protein
VKETFFKLRLTRPLYETPANSDILTGANPE